MSPIIGRSRQAGDSIVFATHMERTREQEAHLHSHRTGIVKAGNYYAGHRLTDRFRLGYNGSGPAQLVLAISTDYFGVKPEGRALAKALHQSWRSSAAAVTRPKSEFSLTELPLSANVLSSFLAVSGSHWKTNCLG